VGVGQHDGENVVNVKELSLNLGVVSMYEFFEKLGYAVIGKVSLDFRALGGATSEVFSGLGTNMSKQFRSAFAAMGLMSAPPSILGGKKSKEESAVTRIQAQLRGKKARRASIGKT